jgi:trehalose 6-phosphate phosphatase
MPSYLLHSEGLAALDRYVAPDTLLAFDLDGTLATIVDDFSAAKVTEPVRTTLQQLVKLVKVVLITGRSRKDALAILGFEPHLVIGNHGAEWPGNSDIRNQYFVQCCTAWRDQLYDQLMGIQGAEIEFKGESLTIHYRKAINHDNALSLIDAAIRKLAPRPKRIGGKYVVNLLPMEALSKGKSLVVAMDRFGLKRAIYFGDDVTDEEIFKLKCVDVLGVHIGKNDQTAASYYLDRQSELLELLNSMVLMLVVKRE